MSDQRGSARTDANASAEEISDSGLFGLDAASSSVSPKADQGAETTTTEAKGQTKSAGGSAAAANLTTDQGIDRLEKLDEQ